jgi:hypothetical protein
MVEHFPHYSKVKGSSFMINLISSKITHPKKIGFAKLFPSFVSVVAVGLEPLTIEMMRQVFDHCIIAAGHVVTHLALCTNNFN